MANCDSETQNCCYVYVWFSQEGSAANVWLQLCCVEDMDTIFNSFNSVKHAANVVATVLM